MLSRCALLKEKSDQPPPQKRQRTTPHAGEDPSKTKPKTAGGRPSGSTELNAARNKLLDALNGEDGARDDDPPADA